MEQVKITDWIQALSAVLALFIAVGVAIWQAYTHHEQKKLQLFEKRFAVYGRIKSYLYSTMTDKPTLGQYLLSSCWRDEALFLFGHDVTRFLDDLHKKVRCWNYWQTLLISTDESGETANRDQILAELRTARRAFGEPLIRDFESTFQRYLKVHRRTLSECVHDFVEGVNTQQRRWETQMGGTDSFTADGDGTRVANRSSPSHPSVSEQRSP